jgi:CheY-like chemotaxis protein
MGTGPYADRDKFPFPRFMIMDLKMPRMNGLEVLEWLRDNPKFQVIPTLVLTSSKLPSDILKAYKLGANSYMVKPSNFDDLMTLIRNVYEYWTICCKPDAGS